MFCACAKESAKSVSLKIPTTEVVSKPISFDPTTLDSLKLGINFTQQEIIKQFNKPFHTIEITLQVNFGSSQKKQLILAAAMCMKNS